MSIETQGYYYLLDPFCQFENNAGKPIVAGHVEVFKAGTDEKVITLQDFDGTENPFKIPLGSDGRATILVDIGYTYDCYVYDSFNNLACSRLNIIPLTDGDITVTGLTKVYHDESLKGQGTATDPLSVANEIQSTISVSSPLTGNGAPETPVGLDTDKLIIKDIYGNADIYDSRGNRVDLTVNNTTNENEAHIRVESHYEDGSYWWTEIDGAAGGFIQQNWYDTSGSSEHDHLGITRSDIVWGTYDEDGNFTRTYSVKDEIGNKTSKSDFYFDENGRCQSVYGKPFAAEWSNEADKAYKDENGNVITATYAGKSDFFFDNDNHLYTVSGNEIWAAGANYADKAYKDDNGNVITATYAGKTELGDKLDTTAFSDVSGTFLTAHQSLDTCIKYSDLSDDGFGNVYKIGTSGIVAEFATLAAASRAVYNTVTDSTDILSYDTDYNGKLQHFGISNHEGDIEVNLYKHNANTEGWFWSNDYFGYRDRGSNWAPYMSIDKNDLRFSDNHDGNYISFKDLYNTVSSNSGTWEHVGEKLDTTAFSDVSGTFLTAHQSLDGYAKTTDLTAYYPITGGNLNGSIAASGTGSTSYQQAGVVYAKVTNTTQSNRAGLSTNGSILAGDYGSTTSQTIGVRRKISNTSAMAGRFQLYSDGNVSFQQISNNGVADAIVCQLQYGQTTTGFNWGTMTSGSTVKHIAYTEDIPSVPVIGTIEV